MDALDVSRWQFGITTVYHFIFVPLTIGLAPLIAAMQTAWVVTGNPAWYRLTRFFGKLFLINFALGVATGIVQEFQFGMNWSEYSRFVGDIFGAPLAFEGLVAFFFESTFLGLWIFGWTRLPRLVHLACIWIVAFGVNASAYFIIAANSFMQHPGRREVQPGDRPRRTRRLRRAVDEQHRDLGVPARGGRILPHRRRFRRGISRVADGPVAQTPGRDRRRAHHVPAGDDRSAASSRWSAAAGLFFTGDFQGKLMFVQQPMKMASAESLCHTETDPDFSVLTVGTHNNCDSVTHVIEVPYVLPFLAESKFSGVTLAGRQGPAAGVQEKFGPGDYRPNLFVTYWAFRAMIGLLAGPGRVRARRHCG